MTSFHGTTTSTLIDQSLINRGAAIITQHACPWASRSFKKSLATNTLLEMAPDLRSGPINVTASCVFNNQLFIYLFPDRPKTSCGFCVVM